jgi:uncharacterized protein YbaP (TraB family)
MGTVPQVNAPCAQRAPPRRRLALVCCAPLDDPPMSSLAHRLRFVAAWLPRGLLGLALAACAGAAEPPAGGHAPLLWEVKSPTNSVYIFGSMHVARQDFYPLPKPVEDAYHRADELVVEVDVTDPSAMARSVPLLTYAPPDSLDQHLTPEVWKEVAAESAESKQDVSLLKPLKPAILASVLVVDTLEKHGYDPKAGIDLHFLTSAHADAKRVVELESAEFQAGVLGGLTDDEGNAMLGDTLEEMRSGELVRSTDQLAAAWKAGDGDAIARLLREANKDPASRKIFAKLFDDRNPAMADKIAALASQPQHAFVVIGAGHLAGENNVLDLLKAKGLQVRRVP